MSGPRAYACHPSRSAADHLPDRQVSRQRLVLKLIAATVSAMKFIDRYRGLVFEDSSGNCGAFKVTGCEVKDGRNVEVLTGEVNMKVLSGR